MTALTQSLPEGRRVRHGPQPEPVAGTSERAEKSRSLVAAEGPQGPSHYLALRAPPKVDSQAENGPTGHARSALFATRLSGCEDADEDLGP